MDKVKRMPNRSYGQFCGLARALDTVGDRWNLLIVRELLPGPQRYNELKASLSGIATNLLAARLRDLEANRIVARRLADAGVSYALTPWGAGLREPIEALINWSAPLMITGRGDDSFQPRWLATALPALLRDVTADPTVELGIQVGDFLMTLRIDQTGPSVVIQPEQHPETILMAPPEAVLGLAAGALTTDQALTIGEMQGDREVLLTVFPSRRSNAAAALASALNSI